MNNNTITKLHEMSQEIVEYWGDRTPQERLEGQRTVIITVDTLDALLSTVAGSNELRAAIATLRYSVAVVEGEYVEWAEVSA